MRETDFEPDPLKGEELALNAGLKAAVLPLVVPVLLASYQP